MKIPSFNSIANVLASVSAVGLAGIVGAGTYIFVNKESPTVPLIISFVFVASL